MWREYAIEPAAMADWRFGLFVVSHLGFSQGRLLAELPPWKKWKDLVLEACRKEGVRDVAKKRVLALLQKARPYVLPRGRAYYVSKAWEENVVREHRSQPLDGIVSCSDVVDVGCCLVVGEDWDHDAHWTVERSKAVERTAADILAAAEQLLVCSRELLLVDPYFDPADSDWLDPLAVLLERACENGRSVVSVEVHTLAKTDSEGLVVSDSEFERRCQDHLPDLMPESLGEMEVVRWTRRGGERLHARYILTELGGLGLEGGLDAGPAGQTTDAYLLEEPLRAKRVAQFNREDPAFSEHQRVRVRRT